METIIVISSIEKGVYFFTKDHCQKNRPGADFVSVTHYLPSQVVPRESLPDGIIKNVKDLITIFYSDMTEIPNPDKSMQPSFN